MLKRIIKTLLFLAISGNMISAELVRYVCDDFGYMDIDEDSAKCMIFINEKFGNARNIGSCDIIEMTNTFFRISNENELSSFSNDIEITSLDDSAGDSVYIKIHMPETIDFPFEVSLINYLQSQEYRKKWNKDSLELSIGRKGKGDITMLIVPEINPFVYHNSWGDSQTASRFMSLEKKINVRSNNMEIALPNNIIEFFNKWYVNNEYVARFENYLLWRNYLFRRKGSNDKGD